MSFNWRVSGAVTLVLFFAFLTFSNFIDEERRLASPILPDGGLRLGLDLQGGTHWVLGVRLEEADPGAHPSPRHAQRVRDR